MKTCLTLARMVVQDWAVEAALCPSVLCACQCITLCRRVNLLEVVKSTLPTHPRDTHRTVASTKNR